MLVTGVKQVFLKIGIERLTAKLVSGWIKKEDSEFVWLLTSTMTGGRASFSLRIILSFRNSVMPISPQVSNTPETHDFVSLLVYSVL